MSQPTTTATTLSSWLAVPDESEFSLSNLPLGVFSHRRTGLHGSTTQKYCATRLGDTLIDLGLLESALLLKDIPHLKFGVFQHDTLNAFVEHEPTVWKAVRERLRRLLTGGVDADRRLFDNVALRNAALYDCHDPLLQLHLPLHIREYTDFYASREHATNVGTMFRGKDNALQPNWLHLPVGYHGRASTVVVSGTPIRRPSGQLAVNPKDDTQGSVHGPCRRLDFELEVGTVVGGPSNALGQPLTLAQAKDRIFGYVLLNDWSARDIQKWEYVPLGPFTSKNFGTTISPWIVMADALNEALEPVPTSAGLMQENPTPLDYLRDPKYGSYDVALTVSLQTPQQSQPVIISQSNVRNLYWTSAQQLVHHSVSGCILQAGDLLGSGTISGTAPDSYGSLLELSWNGTQPISIGDASNETTRTFLQDGDTVVLSGVSTAAHIRPGHGKIGFGDCQGTILPALSVPGSNNDTSESTLSPPVSPAARYQDFRLYGYWRSSSTWRVRVQLAAKALEYESIPVNLVQGDQTTEAHKSLNPMGQVPLMTFTDTDTNQTIHLSQSLAIIEFLDQAYPDRYALLPRDGILRAMALEMVEVINAGTQPLQNAVYLQQLQDASGGAIVAADQGRNVIARGLTALEVLVQRHRSFQVQQGRHLGPYCLGTFAPTVVEAFLVPQLYNARRFGLEVDDLCPTLVEMEQLALQHEWFQVSHPNAQIDAEV